MQQPLAFIPSPSNGVWHLWFIPLRGYALMIILGVIVAVWLTERRWIARGGSPGVAVDVAVWAVPFGLVGGRLYHVITDWELYFGAGGRALDALMIWKGGLGIWGAIALGGVGAWVGCRQRGVSLRAFADAAAPGIVLAQGIGRWGNWFNQELFGRPTTLPWAVEIDPGRPGTIPGELTYHPTFLYEFLWCIGVAALVIWAERRFSLGYGRTFALYVAAYTVGRFWIELLRIDQAHEILGLRLNNWTSIVVFLGAAAYLLAYRGRATTQLETGAAVAAVPAVPVPADAEEVDEDEVAVTDDWQDAAPDEHAVGPQHHAAEDAEEAAAPAAEDAETYAPAGDEAAEPAAGSVFEPAEAYEPAETYEAGDYEAAGGYESTEAGQPYDTTGETYETDEEYELADGYAPAEGYETGEPAEGEAPAATADETGYETTGEVAGDAEHHAGAAEEYAPGTEEQAADGAAHDDYEDYAGYEAYETDETYQDADETAAAPAGATEATDEGAEAEGQAEAEDGDAPGAGGTGGQHVHDKEPSNEAP